MDSSCLSTSCDCQLHRPLGDSFFVIAVSCLVWWANMKNIHIFHFSHVSPSGTEVTKPQCTISGFSGGRMLVDNQSLEVGPCLTVSARGRRDCGDCWNQTRMWVCLEMGYTLNYSHLIVNMMIKWLTMINQWVEGCTIFRHMKKLAKVNVWLLGSGTDFYKDFDCCRMGEASGCRKTCSRRVQTRGNRGDRSSESPVSDLMILIETEVRRLWCLGQALMVPSGKLT